MRNSSKYGTDLRVNAFCRNSSDISLDIFYQQRFIAAVSEGEEGKKLSATYVRDLILDWILVPEIGDFH